MEVAATTIQAWATHLNVEAPEHRRGRATLELAEGTIPEVFARTVAAHPQATVSVGIETLTQRELHRLVAQAASVLAGDGAARGTRILICASSSMSFVTCYLAALWAGATVILANPGYSDAELDKLVAVAEPQLLLAEDRTITGVRCLSLAEVVRRAETAAELPVADTTADDVALLAFTSGTTGAPKGVPLTHANLLASIRGAMWAWRWSADDTLIHTLPLFHQHGLSGLHASLIAGSNLVVLDKFDPDHLISTIEQKGATVLFGVPSIHQRLVELPADQAATLGQLRLITSGSAPLSPDLENAFNTVSSTPLLHRYGLTESGLNVSNPYAAKRIAGTVGMALPGVEGTLFTPDGDPTTEREGEICFRGPQIFVGYLDNAEATAEAFWPGGWFRTGDLGRWADDRLVITGRLKELIITGGMNVAPREVEIAVEQFPGVAEAAVAGLPSTRWGEEVAAWIVPSSTGPAPEPDAVIAHCRALLATYKCPKQVFVVTELPRNAMGKIVRSSLSAPV